MHPELPVGSDMRLSLKVVVNLGVVKIPFPTCCAGTL